MGTGVQRISVVLASAALAAMVLLAFWVVQLRRELHRAEQRATAAVPGAKAAIDSLGRGVDMPAPQPYGATELFWYRQAQIARAQGNSLLTPDDISKLTKLGLQDPAAEIRKDLLAHRELIPFKSSSGGHQFTPEEAILLPGHWVCAYFGDGHTGGYLLLEYEVRPSGRLVWRRLAARDL